MSTYHVQWEIDLEADSPREAAEKAQAAQQMNRPGYWVGVFDVIEHDSGGEAVHIDLDACTECLDGSVMSNTCDDCGEMHCQKCDPCDEGEEHAA